MPTWSVSPIFLPSWRMVTVPSSIWPSPAGAAAGGGGLDRAELALQAEHRDDPAVHGQLAEPELGPAGDGRLALDQPVDHPRVEAPVAALGLEQVPVPAEPGRVRSRPVRLVLNTTAATTAVTAATEPSSADRTGTARRRIPARARCGCPPPRGRAARRRGRRAGHGRGAGSAAARGPDRAPDRQDGQQRRAGPRS